MLRTCETHRWGWLAALLCVCLAGAAVGQEDVAGFEDQIEQVAGPPLDGVKIITDTWKGATYQVGSTTVAPSKMSYTRIRSVRYAPQGGKWRNRVRWIKRGKDLDQVIVEIRDARLNDRPELGQRQCGFPTQTLLQEQAIWWIGLPPGDETGNRPGRAASLPSPLRS